MELKSVLLHQVFVFLIYQNKKIDFTGAIHHTVDIVSRDMHTGGGKKLYDLLTLFWLYIFLTRSPFSISLHLLLEINNWYLNNTPKALAVCYSVTEFALGGHCCNQVTALEHPEASVKFMSAASVMQDFQNYAP